MKPIDEQWQKEKTLLFEDLIPLSQGLPILHTGLTEFWTTNRTVHVDVVDVDGDGNACLGT